jgi:hypothetical protein
MNDNEYENYRKIAVLKNHIVRAALAFVVFL